MGNTFKWFVVMLAVAMFCIMAIGGCVTRVQFQGKCTDYLKLAGDAPTIEQASEYLKYGLEYLESHNMTQGNCAYLFHNPSSDMGIWYGNLKGAYDQAQQLLARRETNPASVSLVDQSNMLIKIREVVIDSGAQGETKVTAPANAWIYPYQWIWMLGLIITGGLMLIAGIIITAEIG